MTYPIHIIRKLLFSDDVLLVGSDSNSDILQNSVYREIANEFNWLTTNKLSLHIFETQYMLITNKHFGTASFEIYANDNGFERA